MTTVDPISASGIHTGSTTPPAARKQTMDSEVFLKLLVTQLANQDPSSPMNTNEMIAQTTQLASMEQLTQLSSTATESFALNMRQTAATLIGREASYTDADGTDRRGVVTSVSFAGPVPKMTIGTDSIALDAITGLSIAS